MAMLPSDGDLNGIMPRGTGNDHGNNRKSSISEINDILQSPPMGTSSIRPIGSPTPLTRRRNTHSTLPALSPAMVHHVPSIVTSPSASSSSASGGSSGVVRRHSHAHVLNQTSGERMQVVITNTTTPGSPPSMSREYFPMSPPESSLSVAWEKKKRADSLRKEADLATSLGPQLYAELRTRFNAFDIAKTGRVGTDEIITIITAADGTLVTPAQTLRLQQAIAAADEDNSGDLDFPEFVSFLKATQGWSGQIPSSPRPDLNRLGTSKFKWDAKTSAIEEVKQVESAATVHEAMATTEEEASRARRYADTHTPTRRAQLEKDLQKAADRDAASLVLALAREQQRRESHAAVTAAATTTPNRSPALVPSLSSPSTVVPLSQSPTAPGEAYGSFVTPTRDSGKNGNSTPTGGTLSATNSMNSRRFAASVLAAAAAAAVDRPPSSLAQSTMAHHHTHHGHAVILPSLPSAPVTPSSDRPPTHHGAAGHGRHTSFGGINELTASNGQNVAGTASVRKLLRPSSRIATSPGGVASVAPLPPLSDSAAALISSSMSSSSSTSGSSSSNGGERERGSLTIHSAPTGAPSTPLTIITIPASPPQMHTSMSSGTNPTSPNPGISSAGSGTNGSMMPLLRTTTDRSPRGSASGSSSDAANGFTLSAPQPTPRAPVLLSPHGNNSSHSGGSGSSNSPNATTLPLPSPHSTAISTSYSNGVTTISPHTHNTTSTPYSGSGMMDDDGSFPVTPGGPLAAAAAAAAPLHAAAAVTRTMAEMSTQTDAPAKVSCCIIM